VKKKYSGNFGVFGEKFEKVGFHQGITCENESLVKKVKSVKIGQNLMSLKFAVMMIYGLFDLLSAFIPLNLLKNII